MAQVVPAITCGKNCLGTWRTRCWSLISIPGIYWTLLSMMNYKASKPCHVLLDWTRRMSRELLQRNPGLGLGFVMKLAVMQSMETSIQFQQLLYENMDFDLQGGDNCFFGLLSCFPWWCLCPDILLPSWFKNMGKEDSQDILGNFRISIQRCQRSGGLHPHSWLHIQDFGASGTEKVSGAHNSRGRKWNWKELWLTVLDAAHCVFCTYHLSLVIEW